VLELVQTMRHFQILSKTVAIGGSDNNNMDLLAQEIHAKYNVALSEFQKNVKNVMSFEQQVQNFEISFFNLRTTIKELERELSKILDLSIKHCTTIGSKLRLLEVFEGIHERDVIQDHLSMEYNWLMNELLKEFLNVKELCDNENRNNVGLPNVVTKLFWYHGLEQRIKVPMEKFSYLYPNLLQGDLGYKLRDTYKQTLEYINRKRKDVLGKWQAGISVHLTEKLQQCVLVIHFFLRIICDIKNINPFFLFKKNSSIEDILVKRPNIVEVNLDYELEKLLKEIHYLNMPPLSINLTHILKDKFSQLKDENKLRLYVTRIRSIANNYNMIMKNLQPEEIPLFEMKLNKIDNVSQNDNLRLIFNQFCFKLETYQIKIIQMGLMNYTWNSVEIPDYIENAHSIICSDVYQNLELTQTNSREIFLIVKNWCEFESDVFYKRDRGLTHKAKMLEEKQK
jgi:hypothetical protein